MERRYRWVPAPCYCGRPGSATNPALRGAFFSFDFFLLFLPDATSAPRRNNTATAARPRAMHVRHHAANSPTDYLASRSTTCVRTTQRSTVVQSTTPAARSTICMCMARRLQPNPSWRFSPRVAPPAPLARDPASRGRPTGGSDGQTPVPRGFHLFPPAFRFIRRRFPDETVLFFCSRLTDKVRTWHKSCVSASRRRCCERLPRTTRSAADQVSLVDPAMQRHFGS